MEHKEWFDGIIKMREDIDNEKEVTPLKMYYDEDIMTVGIWLYMYTDLFHINHPNKKMRLSARLITTMWIMMVILILFLQFAISTRFYDNQVSSLS